MGPRWVGGVTAWAGCALLGFLFVLPAGPQNEGPGSASAMASEPQPWAAPISWNGELATQVCAPNGVGSCAGFRHGAHDDLHIVTPERPPSAIEITVEWDSASTGIRELSVALDGVVIRKDCDDCVSYRFRVFDKAQGHSPLTLEAPDVELRPGEQIAILVRVPDGIPAPVMVQAWTSQPFFVTGTMRGE